MVGGEGGIKSIVDKMDISAICTGLFGVLPNKVKHILYQRIWPEFQLSPILAVSMINIVFIIY